MTTDDKLKAALKALAHALEFEKEAYRDDFFYGGIAKAFEVALEYAWKALRAKVSDSGLEAYSPRDSIKCAGQIGAVKDVETWLNFLRVRNLAVHDYLGVTKEEYLKIIKDFLAEARKSLK